MLKHFLAASCVALCMLAVACTPDETVASSDSIKEIPSNVTDTVKPGEVTGWQGTNAAINHVLKGFSKYTIPAGAQYCLESGYSVVNTDSLVFDVFFDSTAIYTNASPGNQADINKLYGFSDCSSQHQDNSARVGWRYYKNKLELLAYCYAGGVRNFKSLGEVKPFGTNTCAIVAKGNSYLFYLNGINMATMQRGCSQGKKYQLYPYFGGDEHAPHEMHIWVKVK